MRLVLLSLADHANQLGFAFPSIARLADRCILTDRSVIRKIAQLEQENWIAKTRKGKANLYQINLEKLGVQGVLDDSGSCEIGERVSREGASHDIHGSPQVTLSASIGDIDGSPNRKNRHEPSVEPPVDVLFPVEAKQPEKKHDDPAAYVQMWNQQCGSLPKVRKLTKKRRSLLASRYAEGLTLQQFQEVLAKIKASPYLNGDSDHGWRVSFPWVIESDDHVTDILEGAYDRGSKPKPVRRDPMAVAR
jgi:hypothetical protein